jgi:hypothetical protein
LVDFGIVDFGCWVCCLHLGGVVVVARFWMLGLQLGGETKKKRELRREKKKLR